MDADAPQPPPEPFIVDDSADEVNRESADRKRSVPRPLALRLRREAMQRDALRRSRSWSYVGAIVLAAGALQLAVIAARSAGSGDPFSVWLPAALAGGCVFVALRLFRRGRRLSATLGHEQ